MSGIREILGQMIGRDRSQRRSCQALQVHRSSLRYEARPESPTNQLVKEALLDLALRFRSWGSGQMAGWLHLRYGINHKRVEARYREMGLQLPRKRTRKKRWGPPQKRAVEAQGRRNFVWALDFVHDRTQLGQKVKFLTAVDEGSRECLEIRAEKRIRSRDVIETLDELIQERGKPQYIRTDNGPEFIAKELHAWALDQGITMLHIEPGSPWENGYNESFNGKFRNDCLNMETFWSRGEAQVLCDWFRYVYNWLRPHSGAGNKPPAIAAGLTNPARPHVSVVFG